MKVMVLLLVQVLVCSWVVCHRWVAGWLRLPWWSHPQRAQAYAGATECWR
jgi:hypothetical protein